MLIENPNYDSIGKKTDKVFGKFTSFINKVAKEEVFKQDDPSKKGPEPTLKEKIIAKFTLRFGERVKSAYGVSHISSCMF